MFVDDVPMEEKNFPLKLVGEGLEKKQSVGGIVLVELDLPKIEVVEEEASEEPAETAPAPTVDLSSSPFSITGLVTTPTGFSEADLRKLEVVKINAEHPKGGTEEYEGVRLSELFALVGVQDSAKTVIITAADGFKGEVALADLKGAADALLGFTNTPEKFKMVMPGLPGNAWVKDVVNIELK